MSDEEAKRSALLGVKAHAEAFALMTYADKENGETEIIWNSRDGVTPFIIHSRSGKEMVHTNFQLDKYAPDHKPKPGDRIFVDLTVEKAREYAQKQIDQRWDTADDYPMQAHFESKEEALEILSKGMMQPSGQPDLVEVKSDGTW